MNKDFEYIRSRTAPEEACARGYRPKFEFFWGHTQKYSDQIDRSCFSNWFPVAFEIEGHRYPTTEHHMMAEKARLFGDHDTLVRILQAKSPGEAKKLGRLVKNFDDVIWEEKRFEIVVAGNMAKFSQGEEIRRFLFKTGNKVLVEASPFDRIWGIGMDANHEHAQNPKTWRGLNLLGFALMEVRHRLTSEC